MIGESCTEIKKNHICKLEGHRKLQEILGLI